MLLLILSDTAKTLYMGMVDFISGIDLIRPFPIPTRIILLYTIQHRNTRITTVLMNYKNSNPKRALK